MTVSGWRPRKAPTDPDPPSWRSRRPHPSCRGRGQHDHAEPLYSASQPRGIYLGHVERAAEPQQRADARQVSRRCGVPHFGIFQVPGGAASCRTISENQVSGGMETALPSPPTLDEGRAASGILRDNAAARTRRLCSLPRASPWPEHFVWIRGADLLSWGGKGGQRSVIADG